MRIKWLNKILGVVSVAFLVGFIFTPSISQAAVVDSVGKTEEEASQLIFWYDNVVPLGRRTFIQVTNGSLTDAVSIHVQIFASGCTTFNPATFQCTSTVARCVDHDFNTTLSKGDTNVYDLGDPSTISGIDLTNTKGFVVITPVKTDNGPAISFQHLFGQSEVFDINNLTLHGVSAMGRDAVNLSSGDIADDGTVLDGTANGYVLIQPQLLKFDFFGRTETGIQNLADVISIAFADSYTGGAFGGYTAKPAAATLTPLLFDTAENPVSCPNVQQNCFFDIGLNDAFGVANPFLDGQKLLCPGTNPAGWVRLNVSGLTDFENELGLFAISRTGLAVGDATWMFTEGEVVTPTPTPRVTPSPTPTPRPTPTVCSATVKCPDDLFCKIPSGATIGVCVGPTPTPRPNFSSSGSGCSIGGPVEIGTAMANVLVPLVPAFAIGFRVLRRRNKNKRSENNN